MSASQDIRHNLFLTRSSVHKSPHSGLNKISWKTNKIVHETMIKASKISDSTVKQACVCLLACFGWWPDSTLKWVSVLTQSWGLPETRRSALARRSCQQIYSVRKSPLDGLGLFVRRNTCTEQDVSSGIFKENQPKGKEHFTGDVNNKHYSHLDLQNTRS